MKRVVVIGSGRSATSLIAKGLHDAGVFMGDPLIGRGPSNPSGHFESRSLVKLNDRILDDAGGSWFSPPEELDVDRWAPNVKKWLVRHERAASGRPWGMKDPRLVVTWDAWWPHLRDLTELIVVPVWRRPVEIARSLHKRDHHRHPSFGFEDWLALAEVYHARLLSIVEEVTR